MSGRSFKKTKTGNRQIDDLQDNVDTFTRTAANSPFWDGQLVSGVSLTSATKQITHGLGRTFQGWMVVRMQAGSAQSVYEPTGAATSTSAKTTVPLAASGPCTVSLWVW